MTDLARVLAATAWNAIGGGADVLEALGFDGAGGLESTFAVSDLATAAIGVAGLSIAELVAGRGGDLPAVHVDRRLASFWFASSIRPIGWALPAAWDPIAGDYRAKDGWIRLHTNAPHHRAAAERVLGHHVDKAGMAAAVARWDAGDLEQAIVAAGGCAAEMRPVAAWAVHPQGQAVAAEPLADVSIAATGARRDRPAPASRPLTGIRVLDLTRILAGPVASRFLAGFGAEVLRIDPPDWDEPGLAPEVTPGKRCARLDLESAKGRSTFEALLSGADILLHGYRPGALDRAGFDAAARRAISPGLIDVCLCAYGWSGPWAGRRGFDSLVQMSSGIADAGMRWRNADKPVPLPVQALDHATGYLMAATAIRGLARRRVDGSGMEARLSLARTAKLLVDQGEGHRAVPLAAETPADQAPAIEATAWGEARRLIPPVVVGEAVMRWALPACPLGSAEPRWM